MRLSIEKKVTVITPSIGKDELVKCVESVSKQTYENLTHLVVSDGPEFLNNIVIMPLVHDRLRITIVPENTGAGNFYGHRIYAAFPHLVNSDYILFLDEDNFYEPNHIETLVETIERKNLDFSFSLRKIFSKEGEYLCDDNCESLGKWPIYFTRGTPHGEQYLIDTSSFCFKRDWLIKYCNIWHFGWGGDRRFFYSVRDSSKYDTNGLHTLCYRLDGNENSVTQDFFERGNKTQTEYYGGNFPWTRRTL
jgi:glycosyltransferase involved in cell wall biosynthesis